MINFGTLEATERLPFVAAVALEWALVSLVGYLALTSKFWPTSESEAHVAAALYASLTVPLLVIIGIFVSLRWKRLRWSARLAALLPAAVLALSLMLFPNVSNF